MNEKTDKKCIICQTIFFRRNRIQRFCSQRCYWKGLIGQPSKKRNGKTIQCKRCGKDKYISGSRIGKKFYCSIDCARADNFGFKPRQKKCIICEKEFLIVSGIKIQKKTCSNECHYELAKQITTKRSKERTKRTCQKCKNQYIIRKINQGVGLCQKCIFQRYSRNRKGAKNPNYLRGFYTKRKRNTRQTWRHLAGCQKYRKFFFGKHNYLFCEVCGVNQNGTIKFQVHHIYSASLWPQHKNLHNFRNLIMICIECHQKFHGGNIYRAEYLKLRKERGLAELFNDRKIPQK